MTRPITFVHAADLHLDAPFQGIDATSGRVRQALVDSTYGAFDRIVDVCIARGVDFLAIAGDVYNNRDKSIRSQIRFQAAMNRLAEESIPVFVAQGNHDPANGWTAGLDLPDNVHYFATDRVERFEVSDEADDVVCAVYGRSYANGKTTENLARGFARGSVDHLAVGVLHANVGGQPGYEPYAPCSLDDLRAAGLDYWALGHIHKPLDLGPDPAARYVGSPQGLNPNEDGPHGCLIVTLEAGHVSTEFVPTAQVIWDRETIAATPIESLEQVRAALREASEAARERAQGVPAVVRIDLEGRTGVHAELQRAGVLEEIVQDLRDEQMAESPWVWLDRVRDLTRPQLDLDELRASADFTGDLVRLADGLGSDAATAASFVDAALEALDGSVGAAKRDPQEILARALDACLDRLVREESR